MDIYNLTTKGFFLFGLSDLTEVRYPFTVALAVIYDVTLLANSAILLAIGIEKKLHTPMYYFLANLSLLDKFCPSATVSKMLENFLTEKQSISFFGCALQLYFLVALAGTEVLFLAIMAYDRYVAICFPLRYTLIMTKVCCAQLSVGTWAAPFLRSLLHMVFTFCLSFCKSHQVNQYYCDISPVVALSCSSTYVAGMLVLVVGGILTISALLITFISYISIYSPSLRSHQPKGSAKPSPHVPSHLLVVGLFYSTMIFTYTRPSSSHHSPGRDRFISMLYVIIIPILNPIMYNLRNTEVKEALKRFYVIKHDYSKHNIDKVLI